MGHKTTILWFRQDLRLSDNLALDHAAVDCIAPVFIWDVKAEGSWSPGAASRWWLHYSLQQLDADLQQLGSGLIIRAGDTLKELRKLLKESGADEVVWNLRFDPFGAAQDVEIAEALEADGIEVATFNSSLLHDPSTYRNRQGGPFKVFTPFWNQFRATIEPPLPVVKPKKLSNHTKKIDGLELEKLRLLPKIDWAEGISETWTPGERGAHKRLKQFIRDGVAHYVVERDRPDHDGVSMLSPHLHFGEISPRQIWHAVRDAQLQVAGRKGAETYLKEIGWREFAHHILFNFPDTADEPLRPEFSKFPWSENRGDLKHWQKGLTGYPIVDAGMRQLWHTGWMHNRVRMIVASFLTKDLLISWHHGAKWFWDTLVDADLANNTLGWQWAGGCGADAAPYFRVFNPTLQGEKFDPHGDYVKTWVPELAKLSSDFIHEPWKAPPLVLQSAGIELGKDYPGPIVDHSIARKRALEAFAQIRKEKAQASKRLLL